MRRLWYVTVILIVLSIGAACTEQQMQQADKVAQATKDVTVEGEQLLQSSAGQYIPQDIKLMIGMGGAIALGAANAWQAWRNQNMKKTTKAIVKGIENTSNPDKPTSEIKANIAEAMIAEGGQKFYDRANKIVDKLKIA